MDAHNINSCWSSGAYLNIVMLRRLTSGVPSCSATGASRDATEEEALFHKDEYLCKL